MPNKQGNKQTLTGKLRSKVRSLRGRFGHGRSREPGQPDARKLSGGQRRVLVVAVIVALLAAVYLTGRFFAVIALSAVAATIFAPVFHRLKRRVKRPGTAAMLTLVVCLLAVIIPLVLVLVITVGQVHQLIQQLQQSGGTFSFTDASGRLLNEINRLLATLTNGSYQITAEQLHGYIVKAVSSLAGFFLDLLTSSFSGIAAWITEFILFTYLFTSMLTHTDDLLAVVRGLNPLGDDVSSLYISRVGDTIRGAVGGQFVIAICQGFAEAVFLHIAGIPYFFFLALALTVLSIVPLGGGILAIPIGIILLLTGHIWQGLFVLLAHLLVITNIDNVLRPRLVPKSVRMNSALMMLAVFGGIGLFGFLGIVVGPVIMILIVSTVQLYLSTARSPSG